IPETLLESEMFGHERGSFTGAVAQKIGRFEAADGGTIFLDEIGDMPLSLQAKLLRVLQEKEIERVGSTKPIKVDIRVVCATHRDLARLVQENTFREDLYYRINVLPIFLPPLRERPEDIPLLLDFFIDRYNERLGRHIEGISRPALNVLLEYPWPGNVRELENIVQRMMLMAVTDMIDVSDLPPSIRGGKAGTPSTTGAPLPPSPLSAASPIVPGHPLAGFDFDRLLDIHTREPLADRLSALDDFVEKILIRQALEKTGGHRQESADLLGISRKSLHNKMVRHGLFDGDE
ncbi:MAG: sigma 54-interacting transcriptional regulator, partial [Sumerlaeia bacterium]